MAITEYLSVENMWKGALIANYTGYFQGTYVSYCRTPWAPSVKGRGVRSGRIIGQPV